MSSSNSSPSKETGKLDNKTGQAGAAAAAAAAAAPAVAGTGAGAAAWSGAVAAGAGAGAVAAGTAAAATTTAVAAAGTAPSYTPATCPMPDLRKASVKKPALLVVSGAQGGGKTTLAKRLLAYCEERKLKAVCIPPIELMQKGGFYDTWKNPKAKRQSQRPNIEDEMKRLLAAKEYSVFVVVLSLRSSAGRKQFNHYLHPAQSFTLRHEFWCETDLHVGLINGVAALSRVKDGRVTLYGLMQHLKTDAESLKREEGVTPFAIINFAQHVEAAMNDIAANPDFALILLELKAYYCKGPTALTFLPGTQWLEKNLKDHLHAAANPSLKSNPDALKKIPYSAKTVATADRLLSDGLNNKSPVVEAVRAWFAAHPTK